MRKGGFTAAALAPLVLAPATLRAQTDEYEVGAVFTAIGAEQLERSAKGVGARFAYNLNEHFAVDAETALVYPSSRTIVRFRNAGRAVKDVAVMSPTNISHNFQACFGFGYRF